MEGGTVNRQHFYVSSSPQKGFEDLQFTPFPFTQPFHVSAAEVEGVFGHCLYQGRAPIGRGGYQSGFNEISTGRWAQNRR